MFSTSSIVALGVFGGLCIILPVGAAVIFKIKNKDVPFSPFFIGAVVFFIFALTLEQLLHTVMLPIVSGRPVLYIIYGAFAAGLFEETGRLAAYKTVMKKCADPRSAVLYGLGHGGCEAAMITGVTMILFCIWLSMANSMGLDNFISFYSGGIDGVAELMRIQMEQLTDYSFGNGIVALLERLGAITFHTALSVIMFGVLRGKMSRYPLCVLIHAIGDVPAVMYQTGIISLPLSYVFTYIIIALTVWFAVRVYRKMK
ncbi:MAG: YhfC family intramembrane metalloprotease [Oscillospiraceae bacterium]|nr:YhfC family intramembrane metalloprotease [Oscillospiraceae bacterium]